MSVTSAAAFAASTSTSQTPWLTIVLALLSGVAGAALSSAGSRRAGRRTARYHAYCELRDTSNHLRKAAKELAEAAPADRPLLDTAFIEAVGRHWFACSAVPDAELRRRAEVWAQVALSYYGGDEAGTVADELDAWREFADRWGQVAMSTY